MARLGLAACVGLLIAASLIGCGQVPRPFQPEQKASPEAVAGLLGARAGVLVHAIAGLEDGLASALAAQIAAGLQGREIPAATDSGNRASYALEGRIAASNPARLAWQLRDATGVEHLAFETAAPEAGNEGPIGAEVAARVAAYFLPPTEAEAGVPRVVVPLVDGAPGDGRHALAAAMRQSLARTGLAVSETIVDDAYLVLGSVFTAPAGETDQAIEITWTLMRPDGSRVGTVDQSNTVPAGTLDGRWGPVARIIGDFGAKGIVTMLKRLEAAE